MQLKAAKASASFLKGHRVVATGHSTASRSLKLDSGQLKSGRYTLVLTYVEHGRRATVRQRIRVP